MLSTNTWNLHMLLQWLTKPTGSTAAKSPLICDVFDLHRSQSATHLLWKQLGGLNLIDLICSRVGQHYIYRCCDRIFSTCRKSQLIFLIDLLLLRVQQRFPFLEKGKLGCSTTCSLPSNIRWNSTVAGGFGGMIACFAYDWR